MARDLTKILTSNREIGKPLTIVENEKTVEQSNEKFFDPSSVELLALDKENARILENAKKTQKKIIIFTVVAAVVFGSFAVWYSKYKRN